MDGKGDESSMLPLELEGSLDPALLPEVTLGATVTDHDTPRANKSTSGRLSPVRGRTMKEYDQQISDLKKENFSLKMRIYYMEQRMNTRGSEQDVFKTNIELQVQIENLKKDLNDKQIFVQKAALAMEALESNQRKAEEDMRNRILSEHSDIIDKLRDQMEHAQKNYESSKKEAEEANKKVKQLIESLTETKDELADSNRMKNELANRTKNMEFDIQSLTAQLKLSEQARQDKEKVNNSLNGRLKDLEEQLQQAQKDLGRKDRDMENLSALLQDQSHVDSTSILEPVHLKDQLDDQREEIEKKSSMVIQLQASLTNKDLVNQRLEDALKGMESKLKALEHDNQEKEKEVADTNNKLGKYKKSLENLVKSLHKKETECQAAQGDLEEAKEEIKKLQAALRDAELEKTKELNHLNSQLLDAEDNAGRLQRQLSEANNMAENLIKSLGKKEGELAEFQDQLRTAMVALNKSEEAVEALQAQLKTERMEFETKIKEQALQFQISLNTRPAATSEISELRQQIADLQKLIANQNVELLSLAREKDESRKLSERLKDRERDIELLTEEHKKEISALGNELANLHAELTGKDYKIQALEEHKSWLEDYQKETVHEIAHSFHRETHETSFSTDLLQELKELMDLLKKEVSSVSLLHSRLQAEGINTDILVSEIVSVQNIYKQLEEGVEKNSRLHQALLSSLRGENRLSDSPDSNSVQDGGYNLIPTQHPDSTSSDSLDKEKRLSAERENRESVRARSYSPAVNRSAGAADTEHVDRSLQAGYSIAQVDEWVQTSPRNEPTSTVTADEWDGGTSVKPADGKPGYGHGILKNTESEDVNSKHSPVRTATSSVQTVKGSSIAGPYVRSRVKFTGDGNGHPASSQYDPCLTDDAKGDYSLSQFDRCPNAHPFRLHDYSFDEHFEIRRHDRGSSVNPDSRYDSKTDSRRSRDQSGTSSDSACDAGQTNSTESLGYEKKDLPSQNRQYNFNSDVAARDLGKDSETQRENLSLPVHSSVSPNKDRGYNSFSAVPVGNSTFSKQTSNSSPPHRLGADHRSVQDECDSNIDRLVETYTGLNVNGDNKDIYTIRSNASNQNNGDQDWKHDQEDEKRGSDKGSRRNSWAEELEQYRVTNGWRKDQALSELDKQGEGTTELGVRTMTAVELRNLVAQLQEDLMDSVKQNHMLKKRLEEQARDAMDTGRTDRTESAQYSVNGYQEDERLSRRTQIPRLLGLKRKETSASSTGSEDLDRNTERNKFTSRSEPEWRTVSADRGQSMQSQSVSQAQIKDLMDKLNATENTVRMLSKKNKMYASVLEAAGLSQSLLHRSNSETNLTTGHSFRSGGLKMRSASNLDSLASGDHGGSMSGLHQLGSPYKRSKTQFSAFGSESMEQSRQTNHMSMSLVGFTNGSMTPVRDTCSQSKMINISPSSSGSPDKTKQVNGKHTEIYPPRSAITTDVSCQTVTSWASPTKDVPERLGQTLPSPLRDMSSLDMTYYPNITFHSMLDSTLINKTLANLSAVTEDTYSGSEMTKEQLQVKVQYLESMNVTMKEEMRLMEALQHNIGSTNSSPSISRTTVHAEMGSTSVQTDGLVNGGTGMDITDDEEELLRQHLAEIRRLRQRLERLDVGKDPEQLLIFQSHIQQRITRQETMITQLQQQLREKEESFHRELVETQHRLTREKSARVEELQHAISQLEKSVESQQNEVERLKKKEEELHDIIAGLKEDLSASEKREESKDEKIKALNVDRSKLQAYLSQQKQNYMQLEDNAFSMEKSITEQQGQIEDLKYRLSTCEERERKKEEEMKKLSADKSELQADLLKRDRDFLEQEENLFKMELAKENAEKECKRLEVELEEKEKETRSFKKEIEEYRESSKCLKEIVVKREKSLQEKMQTLQKLSSENQHLCEKERQMRHLEAELEQLRAGQTEQKKLQETVNRLESNCSQLQEEREKMNETLKEREAKVSKRDRQLNHLISQYKKLETAYLKLRYAWKEKLEMVKSQKRQIDYLHAMATCSSQEEKNSLMKELVKELVATQRQVEDLLSRLEPNASGMNASGNSIPTVRVETCTADGHSFNHSGGITTTTTITSNNSTERTETFFGVGVADDLPAPSLDSDTNSVASNKAEDFESPALTPLPMNQLAQALFENGAMQGDQSPPSPVKLANSSSVAAQPRSGGFKSGHLSSADNQSLCAILKLEQHEMLKKQTSEALIILGGLEARVADRLNSLKLKPMSESMEYSTMREVSMSCQNIKVCMQDASRLVNLAWLTELPPVDGKGKFYDPVLSEENDNLRHELTRLKSKYDLLDHTVKDQQGRLDANKERHKMWEASLYRQLHKTASDLEQAKENIDLSVGGLTSGLRGSRQMDIGGRSPVSRQLDMAGRSPLTSPSKFNLDLM